MILYSPSSHYESQDTLPTPGIRAKCSLSGESDLWVGLSYEMYIIWMVNLAEIDKQMAEALFQLLNVKQSWEKKEAA